MDFNIDFNLIRSQKLLLIPQLKQAIEVLEMDSYELFCFISNQLESNPALEASADSGYPAVLPEEGSARDTGDEGVDTQTADMPANMLSLKEHLQIQLGTICKDKGSYLIGEYLIDNTDENGYIKVDTGELADYLDVPEDLVLKVLEQLQSLDPPGICARNLRECLLLQLKQMEEADEEAILIVEKYLDALASDDAESVAQTAGIDVERVRELFGKVKDLEPRPGREFFETGAANHVIPDIIIQHTKDGLHVLYNEKAFPEICISESISLNRRLYDDAGDGANMQEKLNSAVWLIKCIEQREDIIYSIAQKLCDLEKPFFEKGPKFLKSLNKASFAASISMHESILEKAVKGKYLQCRWGIYEFDDFFDEPF